MQTKLIAMSTLLISAARWIISRHAKPTHAFSLLKLPSASLRAQRWASSKTQPLSVGSNVEGTSNTGVGGPIALIFDTETTGMVRFRDPYTDPSQPDLVQLGFLMVDTSDWRIRNQGSFLVQLRDGIEIDEGAQKVHGISEQDCTNFGIQHETALDLFESLCSRADILVGHNIRFDAIVMQTAYYRDERRTEEFDIFASKRQICTMMESIDLCKLPSRSNSNSASYKWPSLEEAFNFVTSDEKGSTLEGAHDALVDSEACLKIFRYLVENGHVSVQNAPTESESPEASTKAAANERTMFTPISPLKKTSAPESSIEINLSRDEMHQRDVQDRNGGIDRSREIEETGYGFYNDPVDELVDQSTVADETVNASTKIFDIASFSPDMLEEGKTNSNHSNASAFREGFRVRGNTYKHKEMIKELGGKWNSQDKEWVFRENQHLSKLESYDDLTIVPFSEKETSRS